MASERVGSILKRSIFFSIPFSLSLLSPHLYSPSLWCLDSYLDFVSLGLVCVFKAIKWTLLECTWGVILWIQSSHSLFLPSPRLFMMLSLSMEIFVVAFTTNECRWHSSLLSSLSSFLCHFVSLSQSLYFFSKMLYFYFLPSSLLYFASLPFSLYMPSTISVKMLHQAFIKFGIVLTLCMTLRPDEKKKKKKSGKRFREKNNSFEHEWCVEFNAHIEQRSIFFQKKNIKKEERRKFSRLEVLGGEGKLFTFHVLPFKSILCRRHRVDINEFFLVPQFFHPVLLFKIQKKPCVESQVNNLEFRMNTFHIFFSSTFSLFLFFWVFCISSPQSEGWAGHV